MKYCVKCGNELLDEAVVCTKCGCAADLTQSQAISQNNNDLVNELSNKVKTNGIIWLVIGCIQILLGLFVQYVFLIVGILNIVTAISDINYSKQVITSPVGIYKKFEPLVMPIITLIYNLVFGGVIGVVGSVYYLVAIRGFVMNNRSKFEHIEQQYSA